MSPVPFGILHPHSLLPPRLDIRAPNTSTKIRLRVFTMSNSQPGNLKIHPGPKVTTWRERISANDVNFSDQGVAREAQSFVSLSRLYIGCQHSPFNSRR